MFTGIVSDVGEVIGVAEGGARRLTLATSYDPATLAIGASVSCAGVCLTVVAKGTAPRPWFAVEAGPETLRATTAGSWAVGRALNLERALKIGDELGGHIVTGHVDGVGTVTSRVVEGDTVKMTFALPPALARYVAPKGSIAIDGVSLTVNEAGEAAFSVMIIPHTLKVTTFGDLTMGAPVNLEIDILARYVARLAGREEQA